MDRRWNRAIADIVEDGQAARIRFRVRGQSMLPALQPGDEVIVERVTLDGLQHGDLVLVQNKGQTLLHRFLGTRHRDGQRFLLTGGDRLRKADPLCPETALMGRAVAAFRGDRALRLSTGRWPAWRQRMRAALWTAGHQLRILWPLLAALLVLAVAGSPVRASVTLVSFEVERTGDDVRVTWQTASEIDNMGFYVQRSEQEGEGYERVTDLIPGEGDIIGASYEWIDGAAAPDQVYYYKLEDLSASGGSTFWGPVSTAGDPTPTPSPTPTDTPTPTPTDTPSPTPTSTDTSTPSPTPTATPTPSASPSPTPTPSASPAPTLTGRPSATPSPVVTRPRPSSTNTLVPPSSTPLPSAEVPINTPVMTPSPPLVALATPTFTPEPSSTPQPTPTATTVTIVAGPPAEAEPGSGEETVSEEELTQAKRRLTWTLIGIGGVILGIVLLIVLALVAFALYHWGFLRLE